MTTAETPTLETGEKSVLVVMGSDSDAKAMKSAWKVLQQFNVPCEFTVVSAHRSPDKAIKLARYARLRGVGVIIAAAGGAAHLAGVFAAKTTLPVIGVALDATALDGMDALLSTVMMPPGVPVACTGIGSWGARNAALMAVQILSLQDERLATLLAEYKVRMEEEVSQKDDHLQEILIDWAEDK